MRFSFSSRGKGRESFEDVRREYLAARTRGERAFIAGLPLVPALFATGFGVVAVFKFGEDFVGFSARKARRATCCSSFSRERSVSA